MPKIASRVVEPGSHRVGRSEYIASPVSLTAAGTQITSAGSTFSTGGVTKGTSGEWQAQAWNFLDSVGELSYVCEWMANALSRCTIVGSDIDPETGQPTGATDDQMVRDTVRDIAGGPAGQAALFSRMSTFFMVPGDMYCAIIFRAGDVDRLTGETESREEWYVLSNTEVSKSNGKVELSLPDGTKHEIDDSQDLIFRVYDPHPKNAAEATSPVRACIPILREIVRLGQHVESTAKSRLTGNGILVLPQELSMPVTNAPTGELPTGAPSDAPGLPAPVPPSGVPQVQASYTMRSVNANDVMQAVIDAAATAVEDPGSASATTPVMLQAPADAIDKIKHIKLGTEFTEVVLKLREAATRRLALSLSVPAEILLGVADMNHWSSWQMEESAIKMHVEPTMVKIVDALTEYILRPMLRLQGHPDPESAVIWYDTTGLAMRPNRSADAKVAYDSGVLSAQSLLEALGFTSDDALDLNDADHRKAWLVGLVLKTPTLLSDPTIAAELGMEPIAAPAPAPAPPGAPPENEGDGGPPIPAEPDDDEQRAAQVRPIRALAQVGLQRALQVAGNRMRTRGNLNMVGIDTPRHDTHMRLPAVDDTRVAGLIAGWADAIQPEAAAAAGADLNYLRGLVEQKARVALTRKRSLSGMVFSDAELDDARLIAVSA